MTLVATLLVMPLFSACGSTNDGNSTDPNSSGAAAGDGDEASSTSCEFGEEEEKCGGSTDLACTPVPRETDVLCDEDDDCPADALCFATSDSDETTGRCLRIAGECLSVTTTGNGDGFGQACEPEGETCAGTCVEISDDEAECEEYCRVGAVSGCGEATLQGSGIACAFFAYDLSDLDVTQGGGDVGVCAHLCDCNDDCPGAQLCLNQPTDGRAGVCAGGLLAEETLPCDSEMGGAGGVGGM